MQMTKTSSTDEPLPSSPAANEISNPTQNDVDDDIVLEDNQNLP